MREKRIFCLQNPTRAYISRAILILLPYLISISAHASTITSAQTGPWSLTTTWTGGAIPTQNDSVTIQTGHTVTIDITTATANSISVNGTLTFSRITNSTLTMVGGNITVPINGTLDMGTQSSPIPAGVNADLVLAYGASAGQYNLTVQNGGMFTAWGSTKSPVAVALAGAVSGAVSVSVDPNSAVGWQAGDMITIGKTLAGVGDQTERRMIVSITGANPITVTFTPALVFNHSSGASMRVGNITRNVLVVSSGTSTSLNTASVNIQTQQTGGFTAANAEFADLGSAGGASVSINGPNATASFSSCTFHDSAPGIRFSGAVGVKLTNSLLYSNITGAILGVSNNQSVLIRDNDIYSNNSQGVQIIGSRAVLDSNSIYSNSGNGITVSSSSSTFVSNVIYSNNSAGISLSAAPGSLLVSNQSFLNSGYGFSAINSNASTLVADTTYSNGKQGINVSGTSGGMIVNSNLGYDSSMNSAADATAEVSFDATSVENLSAENVRVNPSAGINAAGFAQPSAYLVSYGQDADTGSVRVWGDYSLGGSTLSLIASNELYASTVTIPKIMQGTSISAISIKSTVDANAVSQLISIVYNAGSGVWTISGSSSGGLGTFPATGGTANFPAGTPQFNLTLTASGAQDGDRADFALIAASQDSNIAKKLLFGAAASTLNSGRAKLTVAPSAGLQLIGTPSLPTLVSMITGGTYYTLIDSGAFSMAYSTVNNTDSGGIQLNGSAGVQISSSVFDFLGFTASTSAYITAAGLSSSATFYGVSFGTARSTQSLSYNVLVTGVDTGLNWTFHGKGGTFWGSNFDSDPDGRIRWADMPPVAPAVSAVFASSITVAWTSVGADSYDVDASLSSNFTALVSSASSNGTTIALSPQALTANTTYYLRAGAVWAGATTYAATIMSDSTLANQVAGPQIFAVWPSSISVNWLAPPSAPQSASAEGYVIQVSTAANFNPLWSSAAISGLSPSTFTLSNIAADATFFFEIGALNWNNSPNYSIILSTYLGTPPADIANLAVLPSTGTDTQAILSWTAPGGVLNVGTAASYDIRFSPNPINSVNFSVATIWNAARAVSGPAGTAEIETVTGLLPETTYYFAIKTRNSAGNQSNISNVVSYLTGRDVSVGVRSFLPTNDATGIAISTTIAIQFNKSMSTATLNSAINVTGILDQNGNPVNQLVAGTTNYSSVTRTWTLVPSAFLGKNFTYQITVTTQATDMLGNSLTSPATSQFTTLFDHAAANTISNTSLGVQLIVPAGSFSADGSIAVSTAPQNASIQTANRKLSALNGFSNPAGIVDLQALDSLGNLMQPANPVILTIPYTDNAKPGIVDGTSPPTRASNLALWWLDTNNALWVKLPSSSVNNVAKQVTAQVPHFSIFGLIGTLDTDLSAAFAYPVPFRPSQGHTKITFTGLAQNTRIRVFNVMGELVKELNSSPTDSQIDWDVTNVSGHPVSSGVYFYLLQSGGNNKKGKLVIIR